MIRLFHPFVPRHNLTDAATDIAQVIELLNISSFDITLDQLLIVPHFELLELLEDQAASLPTQVVTSTSTLSSEKSTRPPRQPQTAKEREIEEFNHIQQLIQKEEIKGFKKLQQRLAKASNKQLIQEGDTNTNPYKHTGISTPSLSSSSSYTVTTTTAVSQQQRPSNTLSPRDSMKRQKQQMQQFNGPCVVCLEPNESSQQKIHTMRQLLLQHLFHDYDGYSVSSSVSPHSAQLPRYVLKKYTLQQEQEGEQQEVQDHQQLQSNSQHGNHLLYSNHSISFRPTLILGAFSSVHKAVLFAKKLQRQWEPLTFHISDLHILSRTTATDTLLGSSSPTTRLTQHNPPGTTFKSKKEFYTHEEMVVEKQRKDLFMTQGEYGCDAMIMLMGEEWQLASLQKVDNDSSTSNNTNRLYKPWEFDEFYTRDLVDEGLEEDDRLVMDFTNDRWDDRNERDDDDYNHDSYRYYEPDQVDDWLEDDEGWDDGATIVVGRTQFFMGDMRKYIG